MPATHKPLPYPHAALEPTIDAKTMEIHHGLHYKAYVDNYNKALEKAPQLVEKRVEDVIANNLSAVPEEIKGAVRNNGIGVVGVAPKVKILSCKIIGVGGFGSDASAIACF